MKTSSGRSLIYAVLLYALTLPWFIWFAFQQDDGQGFFRLFYLLVTCLGNTGLLVLLPAIFARFGDGGKLADGRTSHRGWHGLFWTLAALSAGGVHVYLVIDVAILAKFGYHINGFVWNLLTTPGGFESMGLDSHTVIPGLAAILIILAFHGTLAYGCARSKRLKTWGERHNVFFSWRLLPLLPLVCFLLSLFSTGFADFYFCGDALIAQDAFPFVVTIRMRSALSALGFDKPERKFQIAQQTNPSGDSRLSYPLCPIRRSAVERPLNIVWLVGESMRADLLTEETMPACWALAAKGHRFTEHYSGGHGTRPGMFAMFYGLYGNTWDNFFRLQRGPLLIDWLRQDNYQFLCVTSANFTYPEFDRTLFVTLPDDCLVADNKGLAWQRDIRNTDRVVDFIANHDPSRPFFAFSFFESTHAPYSFPDDAVIRPDYIPKLNYATLSAKDAPRIYNRTVNAAHHIDQQIARILAALEKHELMDRTIIIVTGDHGEEFYEKGFLGHNSTFVQEQIRTPWVLYFPGAKPMIHSQMTHHADMVPTIAPLLGVENAPEDFSVGCNVLDMPNNRDYFIVCGWEIATMITPTHKLILPGGAKGHYRKQKLTTLNDQPCSDAERDEFLSQHQPLLSKA